MIGFSYGQGDLVADMASHLKIEFHEREIEVPAIGSPQRFCVGLFFMKRTR